MLALTVELVSVSVPPLWFMMPPPLLVLWLPLRVELFSVSVPELEMPPPLESPPPGAFPFLIVSPLIVAFAPLLISKTRLRLAPLTLSVLAPGPSMLTSSAGVSSFITIGPRPRARVPLIPEAKLIVSGCPLMLTTAAPRSEQSLGAGVHW